jgi:hypothetical protein
MALVARLAVSFLSRVSIKNTPARLWAGVFFRVGAPYAYPGELRACLAPGALIFGVDVRAVGVNGDLAARETEVR